MNKYNIYNTNIPNVNVDYINFAQLLLWAPIHLFILTYFFINKTTFFPTTFFQRSASIYFNPQRTTHLWMRKWRGNLINTPSNLSHCFRNWSRERRRRKRKCRSNKISLMICTWRYLGNVHLTLTKCRLQMKFFNMWRKGRRPARKKIMRMSIWRRSAGSWEIRWRDWRRVRVM